MKISEDNPAKFEFSTDRVSARIPFWEKHLNEFKGQPNVNYMEIGVYEGRSAFWMLENILTGKNTKAVLVDPFYSNYEKTFLNNVDAYRGCSKIEIKKGFSKNILRLLPENHFDIIYIDGSHTAKSVLIDATLSWELLKEDGVIIFDDYAWKKGELPEVLRPEMAIEAFLSAFGEDIEILHKGRQVFIKKRKSFTVEEVVSKSDRYSRVGNCVFYWQKSKLYSPTGKRIKIKDSTAALIKDKLMNRTYGQISDPFDEFKDIPELASCRDETHLSEKTKL